MRATKERYEPSFKATQVEDFKWNTLHFGVDIEGIAIQGGRGDAILFIFPRLYVIGNNQEPRLINDGTVLRRYQSLTTV